MTKKNDSVKDALIEYNDVMKFIKESSAETVKTTKKGAVKNELKNIIKEAFEEEDPDKDTEDVEVDDNTDIEGVEDTDSTEDGLDNVEIEEPAGDDVDVDVDIDADGADMDSDDESGEEEDFDMDQFKSDDGEYDLTNADTDQLIKVFKRIDGNDSVSITDLGDGKIELNDNETGAEYMIDTTPSADVDVDIDSEVDPDIEIDLDEEPVVSEGTHHSYEGDGSEISEENEPEVGADQEGEGMVDEKNMTVSTGANGHAGVLSQTRAAYAPGDHKRSGAQLVINKESKEVKALKIAYTKKINALNEQHEAFKKSTETEMSQLKGALGKFVTQIKENAVLNNSLGKYVKLILENSTTEVEKKNILNRFANEVKTIEDGNKLFESIKKDLNGKVKSTQTIDKQFGAESTKTINEKVIYQNPEMLKMKKLMEAVDKY